MNSTVRSLRPALRFLQLALLAAFFAAQFASGSPAHAATPAETYIQDNVQQGLTILNDKTLARDQREVKFRAFLESLTDIRRIALFTLGPAAQTAQPRDVDAFVNAFRDFATAVYQSQFSRYSGQTMLVTGSTERAPGDFIVTTVIANPGGKAIGDSAEVDFRVSETDGKFLVLDASMMGAWIAIEQRDQFAAFLAQHDNDVSSLTAHLQDLMAGLRAP